MGLANKIRNFEMFTKTATIINSARQLNREGPYKLPNGVVEQYIVGALVNIVTHKQQHNLQHLSDILRRDRFQLGLVFNVAFLENIPFYNQTYSTSKSLVVEDI